MGRKDYFRSGMSIPSGSIPYGDHIEDQGVTYSIDKFRPRFPLRWGELRPKVDGFPVPLTDENVVLGVTDQIIRPVYSGILKGDTGRYGGNCYWWSFNGVLVTVHRFKPFGDREMNYSLLIEFNPNKHMENPIIKDLISRLRELMGEHFYWHNTRTDFTIDIPHDIKDVRLLSRKQGSSYLGTYYFGVRGQSGYTRIYNKEKEMKDKYHTDLGRPFTRIEWESRGGVPFVYDSPYLIGDLGTHEVLRFVPMDLWPDALQTYDFKTAKKIKQNCLQAVPFDTKHFDTLYARLLDKLGLDEKSNIDQLTRKNNEAFALLEEATDLEKIQATLRKWAGITD